MAYNFKRRFWHFSKTYFFFNLKKKNGVEAIIRCFLLLLCFSSVAKPLPVNAQPHPVFTEIQIPKKAITKGLCQRKISKATLQVSKVYKINPSYFDEVDNPDYFKEKDCSS